MHITSNPLKVGRIYERKTFSYCHIPNIKNGWIDVSEYLPVDFDLCLLKTDNNKILTGWYNEYEWDGLNVDDEHVIKFWKRKLD